MAKYMFTGSYTHDGLKGLIKEGGSARAEAVGETAPFDFLSKVRALAEQQADAAAPVELFGPIPAVMFKRAGRYRAQLMLQSPQRKNLHTLLKSLCPLLEKQPEARKVRWSVDVDPQESF